TGGGEGLAHLQRDARVPLAAVEVAPVALHLAEGRGNLIGGRFDFLQADDVRALLRDPLLDLRLPRPDAVDVPGRQLHCGLRIADCGLNCGLSIEQSAIGRSSQSAVRTTIVRTSRE